MITLEILNEKRDEILKSRAVYQAQVAACDGALKILSDLMPMVHPDSMTEKTADNA